MKIPIASSFLIGIVLTLALALGGLPWIFSPRSAMKHYRTSDGVAWTLTSTPLLAAVTVRQHPPWLENVNVAHFKYERATFWFIRGGTRKEIPSWASTSRQTKARFERSRSSEELYYRDYFGDVAFGLPFPCLRYGWRHDRGKQSFELQHAVLVFGSASLSPTGISGVIPFGPIWGGLLANSLLFGSLTLAVRVGFHLACRRLQRGRIRRSQGLCVRCGYSLAGLERAERCPECGTDTAGRK